MGLSRLCTIGRQSSGPIPQKWAENVLESYGESPPSYISDTVKTAQRERSDLSQYDAFEEDMAEVMFFFTRPVTTEFLSSPRMTAFGVLSSVGGILGLFMGFSILSGIEIIY